MRNKKLWGALCAAVIAASAIALPLAGELGSTEDPKTTITVQEPGGTKHEKSVYKAWRILDAVVTGEDKDGKPIYKYSIPYDLNDKESNFLGALWSAIGQIDKERSTEEIKAMTESEIITWISHLDSDEIRIFADQMYFKLLGNVEYDITANENGVFEDVSHGYYLIVEVSLNDPKNVYSLVMLDTAGEDELTVSTKREMVTVEKKVKEITGSTSVWQDAADYALNKPISFRLKGTIPENLTVDEDRNYPEYQYTYKYEFHDTESAGLTFDEESVTVTIGETEIDPYDASDNPNGYKLLTKDQITSDHDCTFEIVFDDIIKAGARPGDDVIVEYEASLNNEAQLGATGNDNKVYISFTDTPYGFASHGMSQTREDKVVVFTYETIVEKVDGAGVALEGAGFTLFKHNGTTYEKVKDISGDKITKFEFTGLDAGQYKLEETIVPDGYNKAADIEFTIVAEYDTNSEDPKLTKLEVTNNNNFVASTADGTLTVKVENLTGKELPETGGMGTTLFYIIGASLLLGSSVLIIARKKAEKE